MSDAISHRTVLPREVRIGGVAKPELLQRLRESGVQLYRAAGMLFEDDRFLTREHWSRDWSNLRSSWAGI